MSTRFHQRPAFWIVLVFAAAFLAILWSSIGGLRRYRVEVCMEFGGRSTCRTASASTPEQARRTATDNACALLASGMTGSIACGNTPPAKLTWLEGKP